MRLTQTQLKRIIMEELEKALSDENPIVAAAEMAKEYEKPADVSDEEENEKFLDMMDEVCEKLHRNPEYANNPRAVFHALVDRGVKRSVAREIRKHFADNWSNPGESFEID